ncbi:MAG: class I SAM-dependent methyltransferase [Cyclobacteriaceae bacterium]
MSLVTLQKCPVCQGTTFEDRIRCKDHTTSQENFTIASCTNCNLLATTPRPSTENLNQYYLSTAYVSHTGGTKSIIDRIYLLARKKTLKWKNQLISKIKTPGLLLDYGCGTGEFLYQMKHDNWHVMGVEPSPQARSKANHLLATPNTIFPSLDELSRTECDVITMWHVLEHVENLDTTLATIKKLLKKDGLIFVAVPNHESYDADHYKQYWAGYDVPRHLWHFSSVTIEKLFKSHDLKLHQTIPMKLDAYYVSLLSEKYKNPKNKLLSYIRACWYGFLSNRKAKHNDNHSSIIYVFQHA